MQQRKSQQRGGSDAGQTSQRVQYVAKNKTTEVKQTVKPLIQEEVQLPPQDPNRFKHCKMVSFTRPMEFMESDFDPLAVDSYVDAKDSVNNWCVAIVKKVNHEEKSLRLTFEGWSNKYDIEVKRASMKIAPFRLHSMGYTGQSKSAFREFKIHQPYMVYLEQRLTQIYDSNFTCFQSGWECTQFIRGTLFYYVDSILTMHLAVEKDDLPAIFNFLEIVLQVTLKWYELLPSLVPAWKENQQNPLLFSVDVQAALSQCSYEFNSLFGKLFGICKRSKVLFNKFAKDKIFDGNWCKEDLLSNQAFQCSLINKFCQLGGLERFVMFLQRPEIPLALMTNLLNQIKYLHHFIISSEAKEFAKKVSETLSSRLNNMTNQDLRDTDKDVMRRSFYLLEQYTRVHNNQIMTGQISDTFELKIAFQYLKSPFFELRIRGMNDFKHIFGKVQNRATNSEEQLRQKDLEYCQYLTFDMYCQFLYENQVLELIFTESPHQELIKRTLEMLYLRSIDKTNPMNDKLVDAIWQCCTEKHEAVSRAAFQVLQDLIQYLPVQIMEILWERVKLLENEEFDEMRINFLKQYTIGGLHCLKRHFNRLIEQQMNQSSRTTKDKRQKQLLPQIPSQNYLNLGIFWLIAQEENLLASQKIKELALNSLVEILGGVQQYQFQGLMTRPDFLKLAIENLRNGKSVHTSIQFIRLILKTFPLETTSTTKFTGAITSTAVTEHSSREKVISFLTQEKIYDLILCNAETYFKQCQFLQNFTTETKLNNSAFTHKERIDAVMNLIEDVIVYSKASNLDFGQLQQLYTIFVQKAVTTYENEQFFKFLTRENENSSTRDRKYLLDERRTTSVFLQIFCNPEILDCSKLRLIGFKTFKHLFLNVNAQQRVLELNTKGDFAVNKIQALQGFNTLWQIAILSQEAEVRIQATNFLADLYLNTKIPDKQKREITELFLLKLDSCFAEFNQQHSVYQHWLTIISTFIRRFDFDHIQEESISNYEKTGHMEIPVVLAPNNIQAKIMVNNSMKIWQIIIQISKAFKLKMSEFYIDTNSGPLPTKTYVDPICQYQIPSMRIKRLDEKLLDKEIPRRIIAQNTELIQKMIDSITPRKNVDISDQVIQETFDLLEEIPCNIENKSLFVADISKITNKNIRAWCQVFVLQHSLLQSCDSLELQTPVTCYNLLILQDLVLPKTKLDQTKETEAKEKQERKVFTQQFIQKGGFTFLTDFFNSLQKQNLQTSMLRYRTLQVLQKLIRFLLEKHTSDVKQNTLKTLLEQNLLLIQALTIKFTQNKEQKGEREQQIMEQTLQITQKIIMTDPTLIESLYDFPSFQQTLETIYCVLDDQLIKSKVTECFLSICQKFTMDKIEQYGLQNVKEGLPGLFFLKLVISKMIPTAVQQQNNTEISKELFFFANSLMLKTDAAKQIQAYTPIQNLSDQLIVMIQARPILEVSAATEDYVLGGLMQFLTILISQSPRSKTQNAKKNQFIYYLVHEGLFSREYKDKKSNRHPPKCKSQQNRVKAMQLIRELCVEYDQGVQIFTEYLRDEVLSNNVDWFWRTPRKSDWAITSENKLEKSSTDYVGLKNIGCICYMNSILQQLYMVPQFRKLMLEVWDKNEHTEPKSENVLYQLKRIFTGLQHLGKQYYNPKKFCQAFKDIDGSPIDPRVQKDGDEFFNMLIDRIENLIKGTKEEGIMKNLIHGAFANELICKGCPHQSEREEPFMAVQIQVKDKCSIQEGLDAFVQGEMLEGDNAYYCEKCEKKRDTLRRCSFKRLPNVLFIDLKRFEFNFDTMSKFKVNDYCSFPQTLDLKKYTQDYLKRQDLIRDMEDKNLGYEELSEDLKAIYDRVQCQEYSEFELCGIVVHQGTTESGHYYSYIKDRKSDQWFEFNDKEVSKFDPSLIAQECFGGEDPDYADRMNKYQNDQQMQLAIQQSGRLKNRNAYILIYERKSLIDQQKFQELSEDNKNKGEEYTSHSLTLLNQCKIQEEETIQISPEIYQEIVKKNNRFWLTKNLFNRHFMEQTYDILSLIKIKEDDNYIGAREEISQEKSLQVFKFIITFLLTAAQRSHARIQIPYFVKIIRVALKSNIQLCLWLLQSFACQSMIKEMFMDCPIQDMSRFVAGLLTTAMKQVYIHEKPYLAAYLNQMQKFDQYIRQTQGSLIKATINQTQAQCNISQSGSTDRQTYTAAETVTIYKMTGSKKELPILIALINAFIHYQSSPVMLEGNNIEMSTQFQRVISSFCELGPECQMYLLRCGLLLRWLKLLLYRKGNINDKKMCDMPIFWFDDVPGAQMARNQSSSLDAKVPAAERRVAASNPSLHQVFLLRALAAVMPISHAGYKLSRQEVELLVSDVKNRNWWRPAILDSAVARNALSVFWSTFARNDNHSSGIYLNQIIALIQEGSFHTVKSVERLLVDFVIIEDRYQVERIQRVQNQLYDLFQKNKQFWKTMDSLIELTIKLCSKSRIFSIELKKNMQVLKLIEQFTKENPSFPVSTGPVKLFKEVQVNWSAISNSHKHLVTEQKVNGIAHYSRQRLQKFGELIKAQINNSYDGDELDSDDDMFTTDFKDHDIVDAWFSKPNFVGWFKGEIVFVLDEMIRVKLIQENKDNNVVVESGQQLLQWIEKESNKIARKDSRITRKKALNHEYFSQLYRLFESFQPEQIDCTENSEVTIKTN